MSRQAALLLALALAAGAGLAAVLAVARPGSAPDREASAAAPPTPRPAEALLSPGRLSPDHAQAGCLTCHVPFRGTTDAGCLGANCHGRAELAQSQRKPAAAELHRQASGQRCVACHTEHLGGPLTAGFHRRGLDAPTQSGCAGCHDAEAAHPGIPTRDCASCHVSTSDWEDYDFDHNTVWQWPCASCHRPKEETRRR